MVKNSLIAVAGQKIWQKPSFAQEPNIRINTKLNTSLIPKQAFILKAETKQKLKPISKTSFGININPSFDIPVPSVKTSMPEPMANLSLNLPKTKKKKSTGSGLKFSQKKMFTPSFTKGVLGLKLKSYSNSKLFSGFELR
jgi:hypothetical protein